MLTEYWKEFGVLATKEKTNRIRIIVDFIWSHVRYGVYPHQYINSDFYKLKSFERDKILTYRRWEYLVKHMADSSHIHYLQNKVDFNIRFSSFIKRDWIYAKEVTLNQFREFVSSHSVIIIKPIDSWEGEGVCKRHVNNKSDIDIIEKEYYGKDIIIEECISNHKDLVLGKSLNTIRVTSVMDNKGDVYIVKPFLRAGIGDSVVDNYNAGGCEYEIDPDAGVIISKGFCKGEVKHIVHPGTYITMLGKKIPLWDEVVAVVKEAHSTIPQCRYVGWDVAITDQGVELIEGNHDAGYFGLEYFGTRRWWHFLKDKM